MRGRPTSVAGGGALVLTASLWLPWFTIQVSDLVTPVDVERTVSGWSAAEGLGFVLLAAALATALWAVGRLPALGLVVAGALALMVEVAVAVDRIGSADHELATTSPAAGLLLAVAGATAVLLVGLIALLGDVRRRAEAARTP